MGKILTTLLAGLCLLSPSAVLSQDIKITHGPYLQALCDTAVYIVWTTNKNAVSWVELAPDDSTHFYREERPKYFSSSHGFKNTSNVHRVHLRNLKPGTTYRYRVYSQEVISHEGTRVLYGRVAATQVFRSRPLTFTSSNPAQKEVSFAMVNDIHGNNELMQDLLGQLDWKKTDLVFFNGDMANDLRSEDQLFGDYMDTAIKLFASETPMYYARGNHETRGNFASTFPDYFPAGNGNLYYLVRRGPVCFVVLDSGEDKPDADIEYSGIVNMDEYRSMQAEWLKRALQSPEYRSAPYKVVICHMPPFSGWHGQEEIIRKFVPLLNEAGAQVMLSGHLHRHIKRQATTGTQHRFPVLVNANTALVKASADNRRLQIEVFDRKGTRVDTLEILPARN